MNQNHRWAKLIAICAAVSAALALGVAAIGLSASAWSDKVAAKTATPAATQEASTEQTSGSTKLSGVISDSICKSKHDGSMNQSPSTCTKVCLKKGGKYVLVDGDNVYSLEGATPYLDKFAGERVTVTGLLAGETMKVDSVQGGLP